MCNCDHIHTFPDSYIAILSCTTSYALLLICYMHPQLSLTEYGSMINLWSVFLGHISCAGLDAYYWTAQYSPTTYSLSPYNLVNGFTRTWWISKSYSIHGWFYGQPCHFFPLISIYYSKYLKIYLSYYSLLHKRMKRVLEIFSLNMKYVRKAFKGGVNVPWVHSAPNNLLLIYHV